jgi:hypothetical protein
VAGKVHRECAGTASNIEKGGAGGEVSGEIPRGVADITPPM